MSEDRPLTEFTDDSSESVDGDDDLDSDDEGPTEAVDEEPTTVDEEVTAATDPATATYRWQPDGAACARCGATTERQWRDDDEFVCPDCKAW
ncbi:hypothetical protein EGH24_07370 [Halonotius terrestris]|uniref:DUF7573 domain-containing protein n=1 Tax=Halonotius terrestris TaxID=2487750 RepID=A0A8J8PBI0_9EURY|nr:hypothetical protein [Halonotius terrestris]TQQ80967.1 hypothetical protein EGH24_07370 [Halonotius terrestris]